MRARLFVASGLATFLATGSPALAAPPWSEPRSLGPQEEVVSRATIGFGTSGAGLIAWRTGDQPIGRVGTDADRFATLTADGRLVEHGALDGQLAAPPVVFGRKRVALLREGLISKPDARPPLRYRLRLSLGTIGRPAGRLGRVLATYARFPSDAAAGPAMAVGPRGELAIAWMAFKGDEFGTGRWRVRLAVRRANGRFDRIRTVDTGDAAGDRNSYSVAVTFARRDVVVAYARERGKRTVAVRTLLRGRRFDRPQTIGPDLGLLWLRTAASRAGRTVIAYATQDTGEEANLPHAVRAAIREPRAVRFGPTQVLDAGGAVERAPGRLSLAVGPDGTAGVAWSNAVGGGFPFSYPVRVVVAEPAAGFGPATALAANGAAGDVVVRNRGAVLVAWTGDVGVAGSAPPEAFAALRPAAGQPFGAPEAISPGPGMTSGQTAAAAFDPRTGRPTVVWPVFRPLPPNSLAQRQHVLDVATRTG